MQIPPQKVNDLIDKSQSEKWMASHAQVQEVDKCQKHV